MVSKRSLRQVQKRSDHLETFGAWMFGAGFLYGIGVVVVLRWLGYV